MAGTAAEEDRRQIVLLSEDMRHLAGRGCHGLSRAPVLFNNHGSFYHRRLDQAKTHRVWCSGILWYY
jgi:hypothetical protein